MEAVVLNIFTERKSCPYQALNLIVQPISLYPDPLHTDNTLSENTIFERLALLLYVSEVLDSSSI
jgi:hypothetical protein